MSKRTASATAAAPAVIDDEWFDRVPAAAYLGVGVRTMDRWKADGLLTYYQVGRRVQFAKRDLDAFRAAGVHPAENEVSW